MTPTSLIHAAMEIITWRTTCELKPYFLGYKYWTTSLMEKQELEQPNFELLQHL